MEGELGSVSWPKFAEVKAKTHSKTEASSNAPETAEDSKVSPEEVDGGDALAPVWTSPIFRITSREIEQTKATSGRTLNPKGVASRRCLSMQRTELELFLPLLPSLPIPSH